MASSIKSLSVHKNTLERRRKKDVAERLTRDTAKMVKDNDVRAYAVVAIKADGNGCVMWDTGKILPLWAFPETVAAILRKDIEGSGVVDDWKPPVPSLIDR